MSEETSTETPVEQKRRVMPFVWMVVRIIVLSYLGIMLLVFLRQNALMFIPSRHMEGTPGGVGLTYEALRLTTSDGLRIAAWYVPAPEGTEPLGTLLYCHGNAGNLSHRLDALAQFHRMGFATLIFDYRGYGTSEGKPSEKGTYRDAQAAWAWLTEERGVKPEDIIIFGRSLGAGVGTWLAVEHTPRALVVESAFTSVADRGQELYPWLPVRLLCRLDYNNRERIQQIACPVLVAHSPHDEIMPFRHGQELYEVAKPPKRWFEMTGDHNSGYQISGRAYEAALKDFMTHPAGRTPEGEVAPREDTP